MAGFIANIPTLSAKLPVALLAFGQLIVAADRPSFLEWNARLPFFQKIIRMAGMTTSVFVPGISIHRNGFILTCVRIIVTNIHFMLFRWRSIRQSRYKELNWHNHGE